MIEETKFVFSGSGGQGVITAAIILAEAAVLHENLNAVQTQMYGAAARGGATRTDVIISNSEIHYPKVNQPNVLICLTQEAYNKFYPIIHRQPLRARRAGGGRRTKGAPHVPDRHGANREAHRLQYLHAGSGNGNFGDRAAGIAHEGP
jgi:hypothetical protein